MIEVAVRHVDRAVGGSSITDDRPAAGAVERAAVGDVHGSGGIMPDAEIVAGIEDAVRVNIDRAGGAVRASVIAANTHLVAGVVDHGAIQDVESSRGQPVPAHDEAAAGQRRSRARKGRITHAAIIFTHREPAAVGVNFTASRDVCDPMPASHADPEELVKSAAGEAFHTAIGTGDRQRSRPAIATHFHDARRPKAAIAHIGKPSPAVIPEIDCTGGEHIGGIREIDIQGARRSSPRADMDPRGVTDRPGGDVESAGGIEPVRNLEVVAAHV